MKKRIYYETTRKECAVWRCKKGIKRMLFLLIYIIVSAHLLSGCGWIEDILDKEVSQSESRSNVSKRPVRKTEPEEKRETEVVIETEEQETQEDTDTEREGFGKETDTAYAENYAYQTLNDTAKEVYHEILTTILEHEEKVEVSTLDVDLLEEAYRAICADYGGLYWVSGYVYTQYSRGGELTGMEFQPKYNMDAGEREETQKQIDASVEELLAGISIRDSDYAKAKYVFEILVQNVDYDASAENNQNIISAFLNRATVCQGYACATQYLLRLLGIQSVIVTGNANGESHAWNLVRLDGNYYYMDTTWGNSRYLDSDSQMEKYVNYNYLAITSEEISRTHILDNSFTLPECTHLEDNYFIRENRYFEEWRPEEIGALLRESWNAGGGDVAVKFSSSALYEQALQYFITDQHIADYCENISSIFYLEDKELYVLTFHFL